MTVPCVQFELSNLVVISVFSAFYDKGMNLSCADLVLAIIEISLQTPDYGFQTYFLSTKPPCHGFRNIYVRRNKSVYSRLRTGSDTCL